VLKDGFGSRAERELAPAAMVESLKDRFCDFTDTNALPLPFEESAAAVVLCGGPTAITVGCIVRDRVGCNLSSRAIIAPSSEDAGEINDDPSALRKARLRTKYTLPTTSPASKMKPPMPAPIMTPDPGLAAKPRAVPLVGPTMFSVTAEGVGVWDGISMGVSEGGAVLDDVGEGVGEYVLEGVTDSVDDGVGDCIDDAVGEFVGEGVYESVADGVGEEVGDCVGEGLYVSVGECVDVSVGEGVFVCVGERVDETVYVSVGEGVYVCVGEAVYVCEGEGVYVSVGELVCVGVGEWVHVSVGELVCVCVGEGVSD